MNNVYNIKYIDAYYSYNKNISRTKLFLHEAYGYVERDKDNIIVVFIKEIGEKIGDIIREGGNITKGLIIPDTSLVSVVRTYSNIDVFGNITEGMFLSITWRDVVYVANLARYDCSIMQTKGVLDKIESDHIVVRDPETTRIYPSSFEGHPAKKPNYYIIPISFISNISVLK